MTIRTIIQDKDYLYKLSSGKAFYIKNTGLPDIPWEDVLDVLNEDILNDNITEKKWLNEYGFRMIGVERLDKSVPVIEDIESMFEPASRHTENPRNGHEIYISLTTQERSYGGRIHDDVENVIFWGLRGISNWTIFDDDENEVMSIDIGPGDLIFCPIGTKHRVIAKQPRAGISFGFGKLKEQF